jgi:hypothetical protein
MDGAEVAMGSFGCVEEEGRGAKAREGRRRLGRDQPRLADSDADDWPLLCDDFSHDRIDPAGAAGKETPDGRLLLRQDFPEPGIGSGFPGGGGRSVNRDDAAGGAAHWKYSG